MEKVCASDRLELVKLTPEDGQLVQTLFNQPDCIRFIGDRGITDNQKARDYIAKGPMASYETWGYGMYVIKRLEDGAALGLCGLVKRDYLRLPDIGFALLTQYEGFGYAAEAAQLTLDFAEQLGLAKVAAITSIDNQKSIRLLQKLGLTLVDTMTPPGQEEPVNYFEVSLSAD